MGGEKRINVLHCFFFLIQFFLFFLLLDGSACWDMYCSSLASARFNVGYAVLSIEAADEKKRCHFSAVCVICEYSVLLKLAARLGCLVLTRLLFGTSTYFLLVMLHIRGARRCALWRCTVINHKSCSVHTKRPFSSPFLLPSQQPEHAEGLVTIQRSTWKKIYILWFNWLLSPN